MSDGATYAAAVLAQLDTLGARLPPARSELLHRDLAQAVDAAPDVTLAPARFASHLLPLLEPADEAPLHVADLFLACACLEGCAPAIARMQREHLAYVPQILHSYGRAVVDEIVETLPERLFVGAPARLSQYRGRAKLRTWLKTVLFNYARDVQRKRRVALPIEDSADLVDAIGMPAPAPGGTALAADVRRAVSEAIARLEPKQRTLLRGLYIEGLTLRELGAPDGVDASTTFHRLKRIYGLLRDDVEAALGERLRLGAGECQSLVRSMLSGLELSISRLLPVE
jgi:RNA polymerase sigma-70 factor (ECF subfamily)